MNILVVGGGGREHAIIKSLKKSPRVTQIYAAPGNGGMAADAICTGIGAKDLDAITAFAQENAIDFAVVAPDDPLVLGAVDKLEADAGAQGTFLDELVMHEVLSEIRDIAQRDGVSCTCGSRQWKLQVNYSSVDLTCAGCGAVMRIPAATADDIDDICCKDKLVIRGGDRGGSLV